MSRPARADWIVAAFLCIGALVIITATANHYGITYDEPIYAGSGRRHVEWYAVAVRSLLRGDFTTWRSPAIISKYWQSRDHQPPTAKLVYGWLSHGLEGALGYLPATRMGSGLFFGVLLAAVYLFTVVHWGRTAGGFAALFLLTLPRLFAHAHLSALDTPVMCMVFLATLSAAGAVWANRWWSWALLALVFGAALATKMNGVLVLPAALAWTLLCRRRQAPMAAVVMAVGGMAVFLLEWPWMWFDTWAHLREYAAFHFRHYPVSVTYFGTDYPYAPWHYPFVMMAITTPLLHLVFAAAGMVLLVRRAGAHRRASVPVRGGEAAGLMAISAAVQVAAFVLPTTPKYNGVRLFLAVWPFLAVGAGAVFAAAVREMSQRFHAAADRHRLLALALAAVALAPGAHGLLATHPHQLSYYGPLIGGLPGAVERGFEATYWGDAFLDVLPFLDQHPGAVHLQPTGFLAYMEMYQNAGMLSADVRLVTDDAALPAADWAVFHNRPCEIGPVQEWLLAHEEPAYAVRLEGVPLCAVYSRESIARALTATGR